MEHRCLEPSELAALLDVPPDDPRRATVAACPRCDSLLRAGAAFLAGDESLPSAELARAEQVLAGALAGRLASTGGAAAPTSAAGGSPRASLARGRVPRRAGWGWGLGLAAVLAGTMFMVTREPGVPAGPSGVLRGGAPAPGVAAALTITAAAPAPDGTVRLTWPAVAGAGSYQVELYTAGLDTVAVLAADEPALTIAADLAGRPGAAAPALCRVRARGPNGEIAISPLREVRFR